MTDTLKTRLWINVALVAGVVILALILRLNPGKTPESPVPLSNRDKSAIESINIHVGTKPPISLIKNDGDWRLIKPFNIAANTSRVNAILNLLTTYAVSHYPAGQLNLEEFGLLPPAASVRFDRAEFDFGATDPLSGKRYVLHDNVLYLIEDFIYPMLNTNIGGLVSHRLVPAAGPVAGFELPGFSLHRTGAGGWRIQPENPNLSADDLQTWVDDWLSAQAILVQQQPLPHANSGQFVTVYFENGGNIRYRILDQGDEPALYRDDLGLQYSLGREIFFSLITGPLPMANEFDPDSMIKVDALPPGAFDIRPPGIAEVPILQEQKSARPSLDIVNALPPGASTYRPSLDIVSAD